MKSMFALLVLFTLAIVPTAKADFRDGGWHNSRRGFEVVCTTRNARGNVFQAQGRSRYPRNERVWRQTQSEANYYCSSTSLVCISVGCQEYPSFGRN